MIVSRNISFLKNLQSNSFHFSRIFVENILDASDPLIQIALINTLKTIEETYPTNSTIHINELLDLGQQTSR